MSKKTAKKPASKPEDTPVVEVNYEPPTYPSVPETPTDQPEKVAAALTQADPNAMMAQLLEKVTELTTKTNRLEAENATLKSLGVQDPRSGGRSIVGGKNAEEIRLPQQQEPSEVQNFAVFRSPHNGFMQNLQPGKAIFHGNDYHIVPPTFAEFIRGTCILHDEEDIAIMRAKEIENKQKKRPVFVEIVNEDEKARMEKTATKAEAPSNSETPSLEEALTR